MPTWKTPAHLLVRRPVEPAEDVACLEAAGIDRQVNPAHIPEPNPSDLVLNVGEVDIDGRRLEIVDHERGRSLIEVVRSSLDKGNGGPCKALVYPDHYPGPCGAAIEGSGVRSARCADRENVEIDHGLIVVVVEREGRVHQQEAMLHPYPEAQMKALPSLPFRCGPLCKRTRETQLSEPMKFIFPRKFSLSRLNQCPSGMRIGRAYR